jgi:hypothetical protein
MLHEMLWEENWDYKCAWVRRKQSVYWTHVHTAQQLTKHSTAGSGESNCSVHHNLKRRKTTTYKTIYKEKGRG